MKSRNIHLSLLMFFQLCVPGAFIPIMSLYLKDYLGFTSLQIGVVLSIPSIPSLVIPILSLLLVDKIITARKFMILCHIISAIVIIILAASSSYLHVLVLFVLYMSAIVPTYGLINTLVFANLEDRSTYSGIRVWGTVGWAVSGWLVSIIWRYTKSPDNMPIALIMSALFSSIVIALTLKLPKIHLQKRPDLVKVKQNSFTSVLKPKVILMFIILLITNIADKYYFFGTPIFLQELGIKKENIMVLMSIAQIPEILMLFFFKALIKKIGYKYAFILSIFMLLTRSVLFYLGLSATLTVLGIGLGGFVYAILFAGVMVYLDDITDENSRSSIHQLYNFITIGVCGLAGNFLAGLTANSFKIGDNINFKYFWSVPSILSILSLLLISVFMKEAGFRKNKSSLKEEVA